jgi:hypothetical protein
MAPDRAFVLCVAPHANALRPLRDELDRRLATSMADADEVLLVAGLLVRQAQCWQGGRGPVRLRIATLGPVVHVEVVRRVDEGPSEPGNPEAFHAFVDELRERTQRFTVSTFAGSITMSAQKVLTVVAGEAHIDLCAAA